ncbi:hypothetical protein LCGC14_2093010 [marine sediment metagenome]|uniref:Glycosyl transferase family 1 domain-containing protein n=1 Tax=marine sediment metagenome TaxID=412755 RepID=A0A0F9EC28_9ZZZZ|nr:glycosyltransferase [Desulfobacterales bacterium]
MMRIIGTLVWRYLQNSREILITEKRNANKAEQFQRSILKTILHLFDLRYRWSLKHFEAYLTKCPTSVGNNRKGLVFVIGTLGPGGSERQAVLSLCAFVKRITQPVALIAFSLRSKENRFFLPNLESAGVRVYELNGETHDETEIYTEKTIAKIAARSLPPELDDVANCMETLSFLEPSVVHIWLDETNIKAGLASVALRIPKIILNTRSLPPNNFTLHQPYMRESYRWLVKQPGVVLLNNSKAGARAYEQWLDLPKGHIRVIHNGFDLNTVHQSRTNNCRQKYRRHHHIPPDVPLVGTVIRLTEEKRPLLWADIAAHVRQELPEAHFLVVGDGLLRAKFEDRVSKWDLSEAVHIVGYERDVLSAIAAMDLFLLTSRAEGLPNVLLEAQAMGVPVVTTDAGGAKEAVDHGHSGWILEHDDPQHAGMVIAQLLRDLKWREKAFHHAQRLVKSRFGIDRMVSETLAVYAPHIQDHTAQDALCSGVET